jgi:hypothetical protein
MKIFNSKSLQRTLCFAMLDETEKILQISPENILKMTKYLYNQE